MFCSRWLKPFLLCVLLGASHLAIADKADKQKPVELEADKMTVDDQKQTQVFEGAVQLTQGTLQIRANRLEVTQDATGYQKGTAYGDGKQQAWFKQRREGREDYVEGKGERIVHDGKNDITEFFGNAWVKNGQDEITGPYIRYDSKSQNYVVNNQAGATKPLLNDPMGGRVRAVIQPKENAAAGTPAPAVR